MPRRNNRGRGRLSLTPRVQQKRVSQIIDGRRAITADTALRLGRYFGIDAEFWLRLPAAYDVRTAIRPKSTAPSSRSIPE